MTTTTSQPDWITVGALGDGFEPESFILPKVADLAGHSHTLHFASGQQAEVRLEADELCWVEQGHAEVRAPYRATSLRSGLYLVDFLKPTGGQAESVTLVLDVAAGAFTAVIGRLPSAEERQQGPYERALSGKELTGVEADFLHGTLNKPWQEGACPHLPTRELIGMRNLYRYSPTEVYEHIYLTEDLYSWHCLKGVEGGLADTDRCHYYKIADRLYLFVWREKIIPTLGVLLIDLDQHRSDGKLWGYANRECTEQSNFPVASYCSVMHVIEYPDV